MTLLQKLLHYTWIRQISLLAKRILWDLTGASLPSGTAEYNLEEPSE